MGYPSPEAQNKQLWSSLQLGFMVARAGEVLPDTTAQSIFTLAGGAVRLYLLGRVTTVMDATATNLKVTHNPTAGTSFDLAANAVITSDEVNTCYGLPPVMGAALLVGGQCVNLHPVVIQGPGTIDIETDATQTGAVAWTVWYMPLDEGATVVAA